MLSSIRGRVLEKDGYVAVVECFGLGFQVRLSKTAFDMCHVGKEVFLLTELQFNETSGLALFGFGDSLEKRVFNLLISVKGIGGRMAMTVLQTLSPQEIIVSVSAGDGSALSCVPGIGKKTAERICFELADKIQKQGLADLLSVENIEDDGVKNSSKEVVEALVSLGFDRLAATRAYKTVNSQSPGLSEEDAILSSLRLLSSHMR